MTSYTSNNGHHFASRRNSSSSPYAIPTRPRANSTTSPYSIPERHLNQMEGHNNGGSHSFNGRPQFSTPPNSTSSPTVPGAPIASSVGSTTSIGKPHQPNNDNVPLLSREFVVRRISEGETGRVKQELKCEACGKGYKHISSLAKHLWEHTAEWNYTKKLLISKHQQVQLLEAASILVSMNENDKNKKSQSQPIIDSSSKPQQSKEPNLISPRDISAPKPIINNNINSPSQLGINSNPSSLTSSSLNNQSHHFKKNGDFNDTDLMSPPSRQRLSFNYQGTNPSNLSQQQQNNNGGYLDIPMRHHFSKDNNMAIEDDDDDDSKHSSKGPSPAVTSNENTKEDNNNNNDDDEEEYVADEGVFGELE